MPDLDDYTKDENGLTFKQRRFVEFYCQTQNATKAAKLAGYSEQTARQQGARLLTNVVINAAIEKRFAEFKLGTNEVLARLAAIARADIGEYLTLYEYTTDTGETRIGWRIDLERALRDGQTNLIKSIKRDRYGVVVELHDQVKALELLGKHQRLFADVQVQRSAAGSETIKSARELDEETLARIANEPIRVQE